MKVTALVVWGYSVEIETDKECPDEIANLLIAEAEYWVDASPNDAIIQECSIDECCD